METKYRILLATDYSEAVKNAERYAVQFAKSANSILSFLHVYDAPSPPPKITMSYENMLKNSREQEIEKLEKHRDELFTSMGIKADEINNECVVRTGTAGKQIRKEAKENDSDFIIVGTHGTNGFLGKIFGTHSWDVIKKSNVPVLAIPIDALFTGIKNIVFATEYREGELPVINFITKFAKNFGAEVTVLHVTNYVLSKQFEADIFGRFKKEVLEKVHYGKLNIKLTKNDVISDGIEKFCNENNVDWLVMSPEKPFLFEKIFLPNNSLTRKMSFHTRVPLLAVPDFYNPEYSEFWKHFTQGDFVNEEF